MTTEPITRGDLMPLSDFFTFRKASNDYRDFGLADRYSVAPPRALRWTLVVALLLLFVVLSVVVFG
jgi:hypothetical protein